MSIRRDIRILALSVGAAIFLAGCAPEDGRTASSAGTPEGVESEGVTARGQPVGSTADPTTRDAAGRAADHASEEVVLFFGTSLTAGYGLDDRSNAFPTLVGQKLDSAGYQLGVVNAGVPGETSAAGLRRIGWVLGNVNPAVVVLELGANDGLRGLDADALRDNLQAVIDSTEAHHPDAAVILAGMQAPPNLGPRYTEAFQALFEQVAEENGAALVPFLLEGVGGMPELNQPDGIHPNRRGHAILAENVWVVLDSVIQSRRDRDQGKEPDRSDS